MGAARRQAHEVTAVPVSAPGGELIAALMLLATLAYPESWPKRDRAIIALRDFLTRAARRAGHPAGSLVLEAQQMQGTLRRLDRRLWQRLQAADVAARLLIGIRHPGKERPIAPEVQQRTRWHLQQHGASPAQARRLTATVAPVPGDAVTLSDYGRGYPSGPARFKRDVWAPEVMHLAVALHTVRLAWTDPHGRPFSLATLLYNPQWAPPALEHAERLTVLLAHAARIRPALAGLRAERFIRLIPE